MRFTHLIKANQFELQLHDLSIYELLHSRIHSTPWGWGCPTSHFATHDFSSVPAKSSNLEVNSSREQK